MEKGERGNEGEEGRRGGRIRGREERRRRT